MIVVEYTGIHFSMCFSILHKGGSLSIKVMSNVMAVFDSIKKENRIVVIWIDEGG